MGARAKLRLTPQRPRCLLSLKVRPPPPARSPGWPVHWSSRAGCARSRRGAGTQGHPEQYAVHRRADRDRGVDRPDARPQSRASRPKRSDIPCSTWRRSTSTSCRRTRSTRSWSLRCAYWRCASAATGLPSAYRIRPTTRRWTRSSSRRSWWSTSSWSSTTSWCALIESTTQTATQSLERLIDDDVSFDDLLAESPEQEGDEAASAEVDDAPVVRFLQKLLLDAIGDGRLGPALRAVREVLPHPLPGRRHPARGRHSRRWRSANG